MYIFRFFVYFVAASLGGTRVLEVRRVECVCVVCDFPLYARCALFEMEDIREYRFVANGKKSKTQVAACDVVGALMAANVVLPMSSTICKDQYLICPAHHACVPPLLHPPTHSQAA